MSNLHPVQFKPAYQSRFGTARVTTEGYVSNMQVCESEQRKGHGTELLGQITKDADELGHDLTLHARPELHDFYGKHGFVQTGHDYMGGKKMARLQRKPKDTKGI